MEKKQGSIVVEATIFFLIISLFIFLFYITGLQQAKAEREMVSDDIISSELATFKDIDTIKLGQSQNLDLLVITDDDKAFESFKRYLQINLNLDDSFQPTDANFIKSKVNIDDFYIYNVYDTYIEVCHLNSSGSFDKKSIAKNTGAVRTPKDTEVTATTIYCKISFEIEGLFSSKVKVSTSEQVDITKY
jgi:uncharacterized protein YpmB